MRGRIKQSRISQTQQRRIEEERGKDKPIQGKKSVTEPAFTQSGVDSEKGVGPKRGVGHVYMAK